MDFMLNGVMIGGFALVAVPAEYRVTGVKTSIVSYEGIIHEKDLGPDSLNIAKKMELYNRTRPGAAQTTLGRSNHIHDSAAARLSELTVLSALYSTLR